MRLGTFLPLGSCRLSGSLGDLDKHYWSSEPEELDGLASFDDRVRAAPLTARIGLEFAADNYLYLQLFEI